VAWHKADDRQQPSSSHVCPFLSIAGCAVGLIKVSNYNGQAIKLHGIYRSVPSSLAAATGSCCPGNCRAAVMAPLPLPLSSPPWSPWCLMADIGFSWSATLVDSLAALPLLPTLTPRTRKTSHPSPRYVLTLCRVAPAPHSTAVGQAYGGVSPPWSPLFL
jgi:hypothetical protein